MTGRVQPLFAGENGAAALLDMKPAEFREYVEKGVLPPPTKLGRWDVEQLRRIMAGETARNAQGLDL